MRNQKFQHRVHREHRERKNEKIRELPLFGTRHLNQRTLLPTTCHLIPFASPFRANRQPYFAPFASVAIAAAFRLRLQNYGRDGTWIPALIESHKRQKCRGRVFPFSLAEIFRKHFDAYLNRSM